VPIDSVDTSFCQASSHFLISELTALLGDLKNYFRVTAASVNGRAVDISSDVEPQFAKQRGCAIRRVHEVVQYSFRPFGRINLQIGDNATSNGTQAGQLKPGSTHVGAT
jgi:hypothetical protein